MIAEIVIERLIQNNDLAQVTQQVLKLREMVDNAQDL